MLVLAMVFLALLMAYGNWSVYYAYACPNNTSGTAGLKTGPAAQNGPTTQISQPLQPLQSQSA